MYDNMDGIGVNMNAESDVFPYRCTVSRAFPYRCTVSRAFPYRYEVSRVFPYGYTVINLVRLPRRHFQFIVNAYASSLIHQLNSNKAKIHDVNVHDID